VDHFDILYNHPGNVAKLKQAIIQLAVIGKLVPQNPDDEPASVLLEKIKKEKERLINEGKIKKQKPLPLITEEEKPFELPKGWGWCRLNELGEFCGGGTPSMKIIDYWNGNIHWVSPKDMKKEFINESEMRITQKALDETNLRLIPTGSILIVARSGILKRMLPISINNIQCTVNQDLKVIIPHISCISQYLKLMLKGFESFILRYLVKEGMTVQSLKYSEFEIQHFPLPPLNEQKRIVSKVDRFLVLCDRLADSLQEADSKKEKLFQAVVNQVQEFKNRT
jgi:type I restriction enzyme S subunit